MERVAEFAALYPDDDVPRPPFWGGYRIAPLTVEFWHGRQHRLHDRFLYDRVGAGWTTRRLSP
jgi:pyridoxamine 5'-phosphate oxidase